MAEGINLSRRFLETSLPYREHNGAYLDLDTLDIITLFALDWGAFGSNVDLSRQLLCQVTTFFYPCLIVDRVCSSGTWLVVCVPLVSLSLFPLHLFGIWQSFGRRSCTQAFYDYFHYYYRLYINTKITGMLFIPQIIKQTCTWNLVIREPDGHWLLIFTPTV
jgi:hypothetical protein